MEIDYNVKKKLDAVDIVLRSIDHAKQFLTDGFAIIAHPSKEDIYLLIPEHNVTEALKEGFVLVKS
ncbi:hypothetical protein [Evansella tamaricis]|uniref:Uncharacterized protein n=1 Tax=Evansella tamaricis TaxID=2069301 RepID=A0ABS6JBX4_9BACI|nr:hypothetical protein [Evansella tamaricis]MBU9710347.1 hypothetical protein [Evansella tamaricis]